MNRTVLLVGAPLHPLLEGMPDEQRDLFWDLASLYGIKQTGTGPSGIPLEIPSTATLVSELESTYKAPATLQGWARFGEAARARFGLTLPDPNLYLTGLEE